MLCTNKGDRDRETEKERERGGYVYHPYTTYQSIKIMHTKHIDVKLCVDCHVLLAQILFTQWCVRCAMYRVHRLIQIDLEIQIDYLYLQCHQILFNMPPLLHWDCLRSSNTIRLLNALAYALMNENGFCYFINCVVFERVSERVCVVWLLIHFCLRLSSIVTTAKQKKELACYNAHG